MAQFILHVRSPPPPAFLLSQNEGDIKGLQLDAFNP